MRRFQSGSRIEAASEDSMQALFQHLAESTLPVTRPRKSVHNARTDDNRLYAPLSDPPSYAPSVGTAPTPAMNQQAFRANMSESFDPLTSAIAQAQAAVDADEEAESGWRASPTITTHRRKPAAGRNHVPFVHLSDSSELDDGLIEDSGAYERDSQASRRPDSSASRKYRVQPMDNSTEFQSLRYEIADPTASRECHESQDPSSHHSSGGATGARRVNSIHRSGGRARASAAGQVRNDPYSHATHLPPYAFIVVMKICVSKHQVGVCVLGLLGVSEEFESTC